MSFQPAFTSEDALAPTRLLVGGAIINPSRLVVDYRDQQSGQLGQQRILTGQLGDGNYIHDYYAVNGPAIPQPADAYNPTPAEEQAELDTLKAYYRLGDTVTLTAPSVTNYQTPPPATLTLSQPATEHSFIYTANTTTPANPTNPATPSDSKHSSAPKLTRVTWTNSKPTFYGVFDSSATSRLSITFAGTIYTLSENPELTTAGDSWILDLTNSTDTYNPGTYDILMQSTDADGSVLSATTTTTLSEAMLAETGDSQLHLLSVAIAALLAGSFLLIRANPKSKRTAA